jgi:hypothetical protein
MVAPDAARVQRARLMAGAQGSRLFSVLLAAGVLIAAGLYAAWHFTSSDTQPRAKVAEALAFIQRTESPLRAACTDGRYTAVNAMADIGLPLSSPDAGIYKVELNRIGASTVRVRAELGDIFAPRFFGLMNWRVIAQGTGLAFDMHCSDERALTVEFSGTRLESRYLPAALAGVR